MNRRRLLTTAAACLVAPPAMAASGRFEVTRSEADWRARLSPLQYRVMREEGTERAGTSPLDKQYAPGDYLCRGCDLPLYSSQAKYDSGTGWPSFWQALPRAVETRPDRGLFGTRTEVHCRRCGSHLGHIFGDGPPPTGKRHCINGASLVFQAAS